METQLSSSFYCFNLERYQRYLLFVDLPGFLFTCIITSEQFPPKCFFPLLMTSRILLNLLFFETNIDNDASRAYKKCRSLKQELSSNYHEVKFMNVSVSSLGIFGNSCDAHIQMCKDLDFHKIKMQGTCC